MTKKALELLENEEGFFVMLEGALIDVAEHANDAASCVVIYYFIIYYLSYFLLFVYLFIYEMIE